MIIHNLQGLEEDQMGVRIYVEEFGITNPVSFSYRVCNYMFFFILSPLMECKFNEELCLS